MKRMTDNELADLFRTQLAEVYYTGDDLDYEPEGGVCNLWMAASVLCCIVCGDYDNQNEVARKRIGMLVRAVNPMLNVGGLVTSARNGDKAAAKTLLNAVNYGLEKMAHQAHGLDSGL